jgi:hypothetical protein
MVLKFWGYGFSDVMDDQGDDNLQVYLVRFEEFTPDISLPTLDEITDLQLAPGIQLAIEQTLPVDLHLQDRLNLLDILPIEALSSFAPLRAERWVFYPNALFPSTDYEGVVRISDMPVDDSEADRLVIQWRESTLAKIPIVRPRPPEARDEWVVIHDRAFTYVPDGPIIGDADFDGQADISAEARVEIHPTNNTQLIVRLSMQAAEPESDWTRAEGESSAGDSDYWIYTAPGGFVIDSVISPALPIDRFEYYDTDHEEDTFVVAEVHAIVEAFANSLENSGVSREEAYALARRMFTYTNNGLVWKWRFIGDTDGGEAGTRTRVTVWLNDVVVRIREE